MTDAKLNCLRLMEIFETIFVQKNDKKWIEL